MRRKKMVYPVIERKDLIQEYQKKQDDGQFLPRVGMKFISGFASPVPQRVYKKVTRQQEPEITTEFDLNLTEIRRYRERYQKNKEFYGITESLLEEAESNPVYARLLNQMIDRETGWK